MREPLAVPCEVEAASFSGRVPPSTREAVAYVDLCGLALLDPRTLRASHRWRFTNLAGWHATSETTLSVRYIPRPNAGPRTITLLFPPGCAPEVQLDMERKVRMYAEGMIPRCLRNALVSALWLEKPVRKEISATVKVVPVMSAIACSRRIRSRN